MRLRYLVPFLLFPITTLAQDCRLYEGDSVNCRVNGEKHGRWVIFGSMESLHGYGVDEVIREGLYDMGRKQGVWITYNIEGGMASEMKYVNNRASGAYKTYYKNGQVFEEGVWKNGKNTGIFTRYYDTGVPMQKFNFDGSGRRSGGSEWYHPNGKVELAANFKEGREDGEVIRYWSTGELKEVIVYNGGKPDMTTVQKFPSKTQQPEEPVISTDVDPKPAPELPDDVKPNPVKFMECDGHNVLYDRNKHLTHKGEFRKCKLWDGRMYIRKEGVLLRIEVYKNGRHVGDAPITKDDV